MYESGPKYFYMGQPRLYEFYYVCRCHGSVLLIQTLPSVARWLHQCRTPYIGSLTTPPLLPYTPRLFILLSFPPTTRPLRLYSKSVLLNSLWQLLLRTKSGCLRGFR